MALGAISLYLLYTYLKKKKEAAQVYAGQSNGSAPAIGGGTFAPSAPSSGGSSNSGNYIPPASVQLPTGSSNSGGGVFDFVLNPWNQNNAILTEIKDKGTHTVFALTSPFSSGPEITTIQSTFNKYVDLPNTPNLPKISTDGVFGPKTQSAVIAMLGKNTSSSIQALYKYEVAKRNPNNNY